MDLVILDESHFMPKKLELLIFFSFFQELQFTSQIKTLYLFD